MTFHLNSNIVFITTISDLGKNKLFKYFEYKLQNNHSENVLEYFMIIDNSILNFFRIHHKK